MKVIDPIAIIGIGCRLPGGVKNPGDLWKLLADGVDAVGEVPADRWKASSAYHPDVSKPGRMNTRWGGFIEHVDQFDSQFFGISPREAALTDPQHRLLLEVAYEAVEDAGLTLAALSGTRTGVYVGISTYDYSYLQLYERSAIDAYTNVGSAQCIAANRISYFFDLHGPSLAVDTACSSSLTATHLACQSIWSRQCELAFVAGVNLLLRPETSIGFAKASMLSPDGRCKSFDARANGYVRSEGAATIILKPLTAALADGDRVYALIRATAVNQDGRTEGISFPSQAAQRENIREALRSTDVAPESVQYVEAHGTGTVAGDPVEAAAIGEVYGRVGNAERCCVIGSIKTNLGHLEAASGIAGLIKATLCLQHRRIPASLHFEKPNPQIPFEDLRLRVAERPLPWPLVDGYPPRAGVNSFGFGGTNAHVVLEAPPQVKVAAPASAALDRACLLALSARAAPALSDLVRSYRDALRHGGSLEHAAFHDICFSAGTRRSHHEFRLALVARDKAELAQQLDLFLRGGTGADGASGRRPAEPAGPVFVCSGMGQQWWAMGRELLNIEPIYRQALEQVSERCERLAGWSLSKELAADETSSRIQRTEIGQPALFAVQVALAALWRSWGVEPTAVVGHSAGEMAAAYIAGALSLEDAVLVTFHRSRLQQRTAGQGVMLAAGISSREALELVGRHPHDISIAAVNGSASITLSGNARILAEIDQALTQAGLFSRPLKVDVPFHSPRMEELQTELIESLRGLQPRPACVPFFSTVSGTALVGSELDAEYWYANIRQPVRFHDAMSQLIEAGHRTFLEIGAHPILRSDIGQCLNERSAQGTILGSLRRHEPERATLLGSLGRMYTAGAEIDWRRQFPAGGTPVKLPPYPFQRQRHWRESERTRRARLGTLVHPLLGDRVDGPRPSWQVELDTADLDYLTDHRLGRSIVFPGAAYVEMALATARETFEPGPCVLEDIELRKFLILDQDAPRTVQVVLDTASGDFDVHVRGDAPDNSWDVHAHAVVRRSSRPSPTVVVDLAGIRQRCPEALGREEVYRLLADIGYNFGPQFQGVAQLWRGERETLAEIHTPTGVSAQRSAYVIHPAVLDACLHSALAIKPASYWQDVKGIYVPVRIDRIRFHAPPAARIFAHARLTEISAAQVTADMQILDEAGNRLVDLEDIVCRPTEHRLQRVQGTLYEYQWNLAPRPADGAVRDSHHVLPPDALDPVLRKYGESLLQRFDRARYQNECQRLSRAAAAAYIVHALGELGWRPEGDAALPIDTVAERLGIIPEYVRWLRLVLNELSADEIASHDEPRLAWRRLWDAFPECHLEATLLRQCGEKLADVLRGAVDPLSIIFPEGSLATAAQLYEDSPSLRVNNLLVQKALSEIVRHLPKGKALRILEVGGGTGGMTGAILPVLPEHCTEYVFTDVSSSFTTQAQHKFAKYPFVQYRTLDIDRDPLEQGFDAHSFDLIVASDVLHATKDLGRTLERIRRLLGSAGTLVLAEPTRPWLIGTVTFGLLKGWWLFEDVDIRPDEPCVAQEQWRSLLSEAQFSAIVCIADCPDSDSAQHSVILARGPALAPSSQVPARAGSEPHDWLVFVDEGSAARPSVGAQLGLELARHGDRVIKVTHGTSFASSDPSCFCIRAGNAEDMRRLIDAVSRQAPHLAGVVHLWSLDVATSESMTCDALVACTRLASISALQLIQAIAALDGASVDSVRLVTHRTQLLGYDADALELAQSPLWGLGRVAVTEYQNRRWQLIDLATCSREEIGSLAAELLAADSGEDEVALAGELRYVRRLVPVTPATLHGMGRRAGAPAQPYRIELQRPGTPDSLSARPILRVPPGPGEIEIEVVAVGLNFMDLMLTMGMLPREAMTGDPTGRLLGLECAGRVTAVGERVSAFAVGNEVVAGAGGRFLATHVRVDQRYVAHKPRSLSFEQAATIPVAFLTAHHSLHTLGCLQSGERVLIHSATGGVGLAAVQLAVRAGAVVLATAGSSEKRELLALLGVQHVMDSRSLAFADEVLELTAGEGVDLVLNSLAGDAIDKNLSILRPRGRFIEIGKSDIYRNRKIGMRPLRKNVSLFAADLNTAFDHLPAGPGPLLREVLQRFESDDLRPLPHRVFPAARVEDALRYMTQGKHVGKLIIAMQEGEGVRVEDGPRPLVLNADGSYLITGGLGGLGLAVAERLVRRGARHLALVGRSDPSAAAQAAVESLRQRGAEVMVCRANIADRDQTHRLIMEVQETMGQLRGIIHTAMVLDDASIENLTERRMWTAMKPKVMGAWNLHALTADIPLQFFVLFSSAASIIGNPGQANYVAANAFLDALAYYRRGRGLPALTVNWGAVAEIGHVARSAEAAQKLDRFGIKTIGASEMLDALDELMASGAAQVTVAQFDWKEFLRLVGSRIPGRFGGLTSDPGPEADRSTVGTRMREIFETDATALPLLLETYIRDQLASAMGALPAQIDVQQPLLSLGLDSLIAVEVRNRINADLGLNVPLARFMHGASIGSLAAYIAERLLEGAHGKQPPATPAQPPPGPIRAPVQAAGEPTSYSSASAT